MAQICRRCGDQVQDNTAMTVSLEQQFGTEKHQRFLREGTDHLSEGEKALASRSDAERTYCARCYYLCSDRGHNIWECGVRHPANDPAPAAHG